MVSYCTLTESALNAVQLIYLNLIMDIFGALALASTRPESGKVTYNAGDRVMTPHMYRQIFGMAIFMVTIMMVVMFAGKNLFNLNYSASTQTTEKPDAIVDANGDNILDAEGNKTYGPDFGGMKMQHFTLIFNTFVFLQVFNLVNCRDVSAHGKWGFSGLHKNFMTILIILVICGVQVLSCLTGLGRPIFETKAVDMHSFSITIVCAISCMAVNALLKVIPDRWISKMPSLDENSKIGGNSKLMSAYDTQSKAKALSAYGAVDEKEESEMAESLPASQLAS